MGRHGQGVAGTGIGLRVLLIDFPPTLSPWWLLLSPVIGLVLAVRRYLPWQHGQNQSFQLRVSRGVTSDMVAALYSPQNAWEHRPWSEITLKNPWSDIESEALVPSPWQSAVQLSTRWRSCLAFRSHIMWKQQIFKQWGLGLRGTWEESLWMGPRSMPGEWQVKSYMALPYIYSLFSLIVITILPSPCSWIYII